MKNALKLLIIVVIVSAFTVCASADTVEDYINDYEEIVPDELRDMQSEIKNGRFDIAAFFEEVIGVISGRIPGAIGFLSALLGLTLLMGSAGLLPDKLRGVTDSSLSALSALFVGGIAASAFSEIVGAIDTVSSFFSGAVPILCSITLAGGGVSGAAAQAAGMNTVLSVVGGGFIASLSLVSGFSLAMGLAVSLGGEGAATVGKWSKGIFLWIFGIATALLMGTMSLQTLISSSADSAAMRTAKYMASGYIPFVGGTVSASLSTLAAGLSYVKGVVGASMIAVIFMLFLPPLVLALSYRLALSVASGFAALTGVCSAEKSFSSFRSFFDMLIGVYCLCCILFAFEIVLFIKSGVAVA